MVLGIHNIAGLFDAAAKELLKRTLGRPNFLTLA
jgi:hypothetical protein